MLLLAEHVSEISDGMWNVLGIGVYLVVGFGLLGGWKHWTPSFRAVYAVCFPLHAIVASLWRDVHGATGSTGGVLAWAVVIFVALCLLLG